jgi:hypothetical protein
MIQMAHMGNQIMTEMEKQAPQMFPKEVTPEVAARELAPISAPQ